MKTHNPGHALTISKNGKVLKFLTTQFTYPIKKFTIPKTVEHLELSFLYDYPIDKVIFNKKLKTIKTGWGDVLKVENLPFTINTILLRDKFSKILNPPFTTKNIVYDGYSTDWKNEIILKPMQKIPYGSTFKASKILKKNNKII